MNAFPRMVLAACLAGLATASLHAAVDVPEPLKPWIGWALWKDDLRNSPSPFNDGTKQLPVWPTRLALNIQPTEGRFDFQVTVFSECWIALPGNSEIWPANVRANGQAIPVVPRDSIPSIHLQPGSHRVDGVFRWSDPPQRLAIPSSFGILALAVNGSAVDFPAWDASGSLWLRRNTAAPPVGEKDFLGVKIYSLLEDGIPVWLRSEIELVVGGKSREEDIGVVLPEGWNLASLEGPIPVAINSSGELKAQVRPGKWVIKISAFRTDNPTQIRFASGVKPAVADELIAFRSKPDFRLVDLSGAPAIDVSQVAFPSAWQNLPVYRWETNGTLTLTERLRGMGVQNPQGISLSKVWWLDEKHGGITFRDQISGTMQEMGRLDVAEGQDLGSVRSGNDGQLITKNPSSGASGVEVRTRNLNLTATGTIPPSSQFSATGWQADADSVTVTLNLPPGWRLFALFGADWVNGDWLTSWTLLDLFLLLIFSLAVFRLWGFVPGVLAFLAFGASYHEPDAPRYIWLALLMPLALLRVVPEGWGRRLLEVIKWGCLVLLVLILIPFLAQQIQQTIYPQLEVTAPLPVTSPMATSAEYMDNDASTKREAGEQAGSYLAKQRQRSAPAEDKSNLLLDPKARIQTGPGVPEWTWRTATFGWNGPVSEAQTVRPILIPLPLERLLSTLRVILLICLAALLFQGGKRRGGGWSKASVPMLLAAFLLIPAAAHAQFPDDSLLQTLRARLLEPSDAFPTAADISSVDLTLSGNRITMDVEISCATRCAVPLPGRLPAWSPLSVSVNGKPESVLRRNDGYLWVVLPEGVQRMRVEGLIPPTGEWQWTFLLKPRRVTVNAPEWNVAGLRPDGVPDQQVFFSLKQKAATQAASYELPDLQSLVLVDRHLELGLVWQVTTTVTRLTPPGRAISLQIPLLAGERVLTPGQRVENGMALVSLGASAQGISWQSEMNFVPNIPLQSTHANAWVERWQVQASPVWNVAFSGLPPTYEQNTSDLIPVWHPWPGESANLQISRPEAVPGSTITVGRVAHETSLGRRQRTTTLSLSLNCSLGQDFQITLPLGAAVTSLQLNGSTLPVRVENGQLIVPIRPGEQSLSLGWKNDEPLNLRVTADKVVLPVAAANISSSLQVPEDRWVLSAFGPLRGPAVQFWTILICSLLAAWALGQWKGSALKTHEWALLAIGLTQVPLPCGLLVVGWFILLTWRGKASFPGERKWLLNLLQLVLIGLTAIVLGIFVATVAAGLLGSPQMFIQGNGSTRTMLQWYSATSEGELPRPGFLSVSIWWYRFLMLAWALWLAASLLRWLRWGWEQFSKGGCFHRKGKPPVLPS